MVRLTIGESAQPTALADRIQHHVMTLKQRGVALQVERHTMGHGHPTLITISGKDDSPAYGDEAGDHETMLRHRVAEAISETVLEDLETSFLRRAAAKMRPYYDEALMQSVVEKASSLLLTWQRLGASERSAVLQRVTHYLAEQNVLLLDGFVRFWLKDYCVELSDCVRQVIDDYEAEQERREFIALLKEFVAGRYTGMKVVHVLPDRRRSFQMVDDDGHPVDWGYGCEWGWLDDDVEVDQEELLMASLVMVVPQRVIFHASDWRNMDTVLEVFGERIQFCSGCKRCTDYRGNAPTR